jgi:hypothetical protein
MLRKRPWLWIVFAFVVLITVWFFFIKIAVENQPETVPLVKERGNDHAGR